MDASTGDLAVGFFGVAACIMSFLSSFWCRNYEFTAPELPSMSIGVWNYQTVNVGTINGDIFVLKTCSAYSDSIDVDSYWKAARAFSIMAPVLGFLLVASVFCLRGGMGRKAAGMKLIVLVTTMQGLTLLMLKSESCESVPLPLVESLYTGSCQLASGAYVSIAATVCWFLAGLAMVCGPAGEDESK